MFRGVRGTLTIIVLGAVIIGAASWYYLTLARRGQVAASDTGPITGGGEGMSPVTTYTVGLVVSIVVAVLAIVMLVLVHRQERRSDSSGPTSHESQHDVEPKT